MHGILMAGVMTLLLLLSVGASFAFGTTTFPNRTVTALSADGAITPQTADDFFAIIKAGAAALTLALPTVDGQTLTFSDTGGHAHTITVPIASPPTAGFNGTKATATFNGTVGSFLTIKSYNGSWYVLGSSGVTVA